MNDSKEAKDVLIECPVKTADGKQIGIIQKSDSTTQVVEIHPLEDGKPIHGDAVWLEPKETPGMYDVTPMLPGSRKGPAKVATETYRSGWDQVFGKKQAVGQA